ncbi:MAG: hypothetical protein ACE5Z5_09835 [Candidatus Bathyarchaeia archaeon]
MTEDVFTRLGQLKLLDMEFFDEIGVVGIEHVFVDEGLLQGMSQALLLVLSEDDAVEEG